MSDNETPEEQDELKREEDQQQQRQPPQDINDEGQADQDHHHQQTDDAPTEGEDTFSRSTPPSKKLELIDKLIRQQNERNSDKEPTDDLQITLTRSGNEVILEINGFTTVPYKIPLHKDQDRTLQEINDKINELQINIDSVQSYEIRNQLSSIYEDNGPAGKRNRRDKTGQDCGNGEGGQQEEQESEPPSPSTSEE